MISFRESTLINLVIHSTLRHLTDSPNYKVDITNARDIAPYLCNTQRKFNEYHSKIRTGQVDESYSLVDENFNVISTEDFEFKQINCYLFIRSEYIHLFNSYD